MQMPLTSSDGFDRDVSAKPADTRHRQVDRVYKAEGVLALVHVPVLAGRAQDAGRHPRLRLRLHAALILFTFEPVASLVRLSLPLPLKSVFVMVMTFAPQTLPLALGSYRATVNRLV